MYKVDDYVVYKKDVCRVKDIKENKSNKKLYYFLVPVSDESLMIELPVNNDLCNVRNIISKKDALKLINDIPNIEVIQVLNDKMIEGEYKFLLRDGSHESLVKIIKTSFIRNKNRIDNNKKVSDRDSNYFKKAEDYLYNELSLALNMTYDEVKDYVYKTVKENIESK